MNDLKMISSTGLTFVRKKNLYINVVLGEGGRTLNCHFSARTHSLSHTLTQNTHLLSHTLAQTLTHSSFPQSTGAGRGEIGSHYKKFLHTALHN